jgi:hypothetical protein
MLVQLALGIAVGYGPPPTRRLALRLSAAEPPPDAASEPFSYGEYSLREQASNAVWNLVVKPAVERRRREMEAGARTAAAHDPAPVRAPVLVPEDAPAVARAVATTAAATPQEVDAVALAVHELSALAGSAAVPYSASQIVHAFNAWKSAVGRKYSNLDGEALELRAFAGNPSLVAKYLHHVVEVPQPAERATVLTIPAPMPGEDWRTAYHRAADVRAAAIEAGRRAAAGRAAADDQLRLRQQQISSEKVEALELVHARHREELKRATEAVAHERAKLAEAMARLAADEEQQHALADHWRQSASDQVVNKAAVALAAAEEALVGELRIPHISPCISVYLPVSPRLSRRAAQVQAEPGGGGRGGRRGRGRA